MTPLGYLITLRTYGTWIHGDIRGSVDRRHNIPGTPLLKEDEPRASRELDYMNDPPLELTAESRFVVDAVIREVCDYRKWYLHAVHPRTTHVHLVVTASHSPERVMNDVKGYCTSNMRESETIPVTTEPWVYHGSTRYLNTPNSLARAIHYVLYEQGELLPMIRPAKWDQVQARKAAKRKASQSNP